MLTILPDNYGDTHYEFVQGQAINQQHYTDMLQCLQ